MNITEVKEKLVERKKWVVAGLLVITLGSFFFSESFRNTLARRRALAKSEIELQDLAKETDLIRKKLSRLESDNKSYEELVRKELGYMRPGEKEVRFVEK